MMESTKNTAIALPMSIKKYLYSQKKHCWASFITNCTESEKNLPAKRFLWELTVLLIALETYFSKNPIMQVYYYQIKIKRQEARLKNHERGNNNEILINFNQRLDIFIRRMTSIRKNLAQYLLRWNSLEIMAEQIREKIAQNPYYQMETVFQRFDKFKKGYLIPDDFSEFMLENKIYPTESELYLIFRDFDKDRVGVVTLQRFAQQLLPKQNVKLNKKALQRKYYEAGLRLSIDLEYLIARYFDHKIKQIQELSKLRLVINERSPYIVEQAFTLLDHQKKGVIQSLNQIDHFLRSNGKVLHKDDLVRLHRLFCFDKDSPVLYQMFAQHLDPFGKGFYIGYSQRVAEKAMIQQDYIKQKIQVNNQAVRNSHNRIILHNSIEDLQVSNSRLHGIIKEQELQQRLQEQNLLELKRRRYLY